MGSAITVNALRAKRGQAHCYVLRAIGLGSAVTHPFALRHDYCLARLHVEGALLVLDVQLAAQDQRVFIEVGSLFGSIQPPGERMF